MSLLVLVNMEYSKNIHNLVGKFLKDKVHRHMMDMKEQFLVDIAKYRHFHLTHNLTVL
jgi:hypothetical protein